MTSPNLSAEVTAWCLTELGSPPLEVLHSSEQMSSVLGLRLESGEEVALKTRHDDPAGRGAACVAVQQEAARAGQPVARPLTPARAVLGPGGERLVRHAEVWRAGGEMMRDDGPGAGALAAVALASLMETLERLDPRTPIVSPPWVGWDHEGPDVFPPIPFLDERDQRAVPAPLMEAALQAKELLRASPLPHVVGHADFEAQNLRWHDDVLWCIHDFDSVATAPEAAFVGAAAGAFCSQETPTLAPLASSQVFLRAYQEARTRSFSAHEIRVAWAAGLWPAVWNARAEALLDHPRATTEPLLAQVEERSRLAGLPGITGALASGT